MSDLVIGDERIRRIFQQLPFRLRTTNVYRRALRKAAREELIPAARAGVPSEGNFEHMSRVRRGITIRNLRDKVNPGVIVVVKGRDVPVGQGRSRRFWNLRGYAYLVAHGNYKTPDRMTRGKGRRGDVEGIGNFMDDARRRKGNAALAKGVKYLIPEIDKEIRKLL